MRWALIFVAGCSFSPGATGSGSDAAIPGDDARTMPGDGSSTMHDPNAHLIAWYKMDAIVNKTAHDETGHGHEATCTTCPMPDPMGHTAGGFKFDGTSRFDIDDGGAFDSTTFTISLWAKWSMPSYMGETYSCPVGKVFQSGIYNTWEVCNDKSDSGHWLYDTAVIVNNLPDFDHLRPATGPKPNEWHHIGLVWDGSAKQLYIDGTVLGSDHPLSPPPFDSTGKITFGADTDAGVQSSPFVGTLDELKIFDEALTPSEIADLANQ